METKKEITDFGFNLDNSYSRLPKLFYSDLKINPVSSPNLIILNKPLAEFLGLNINGLQGNDGLAVLAGNKVPNGSLPIAQAYAGHQFGYFTMLGDGRAMLLGEQIAPNGERFDIQLKGSGITPYSRGGDGRAALGPMLREYIISEAMHDLGIPTTRSLAVVSTGETVFREAEQPGAILTRVAASHIRVGTFGYISEWGTEEDLIALADYTIQRHFSQIYENENRYLLLLKQVVSLQASLIAKWQLVGFIHGVMNTDNVSICGETIDYGPCAFMDIYDPATVFSSIDIHGRYAFENQPNIALWNLARFAETLLPLLNKDREQAINTAQDAIFEFNKLYHENWLSGMKSKLGIINDEKQDESLIANLLSIMQKYRADYTNTFVALTLDKFSDNELFKSDEFIKWQKLWQERLSRQSEPKSVSQQLMQSSNPQIIPRNHKVEEALDAAVKQGDLKVMERLLCAISNPFAYSAKQDEYTNLPQVSNKPYKTFCGT